MPVASVPQLGCLGARVGTYSGTQLDLMVDLVRTCWFMAARKPVNNRYAIAYGSGHTTIALASIVSSKNP